MIQTALIAARGQFLILAFCIVCCGAVAAHDALTPGPALTTFEVERVLSALERLVGTLAKADAGQAASLPDDAVGLVALVSILPAAVADLDTGVRQTSPSLQNVLAASGYAGSVEGFWQWSTDTERVLLAYEILDRDLNYERASSERDLDILNSALLDADAVRTYKTQLDEFVQRLTGSDG